MYLAIRIILGLLLLASGLEKALSPYQNFLYVVEAYDAFPMYIEVLIARCLPWVELIAGLFMILGLYLPAVVKFYRLLFFCFIILLGQAFIRSLPLEDCGCFGQLISIPPYATMTMDIIVFLLLGRMQQNMQKVQHFSLDQKWL